MGEDSMVQKPHCGDTDWEGHLGNRKGLLSLALCPGEGRKRGLWLPAWLLLRRPCGSSVFMVVSAAQ